MLCLYLISEVSAACLILQARMADPSALGIFDGFLSLRRYVHALRVLSLSLVPPVTFMLAQLLLLLLPRYTAQLAPTYTPQIGTYLPYLARYLPYYDKEGKILT